MHVLDFLTKLQKAEISVTLLKSRRSPSNIENSQNKTKETPGVEAVFGIVIGKWIGQFEFSKGTLPETSFVIIFQNFYNSGFADILSKMY